MGNNHGWINFSWVPKKKWTSCLDWDTFVVRHQRACLLWKHICLLRCVQKPKTSLTSQHVCASTGCERYFNLYMLYAFFSFNSVPRQVDFRHKVCRVQGFTCFTFGVASLSTMTLIAVSRYFCVTKQEKYVLLFSKRRILVYIAGVCCVALAGSVPPLFFARGGYRLTPGHAACMYAFETNIAYTIFVKCVYIATPFSLITSCYIKVFCTVSRKNQLFSQENSPQKLRANLQEVKVTKTLATVMVCFTFCWIPVGIMDFIDAMRGGNTLPRAAYLIYGVLVYLSSTINPFIYAARNRHFRQEYKAILRKCCRFQSCEMGFGIRCCKVRGFAAWSIPSSARS